VELDPSFVELVRDAIGQRNNARILHADVLKNKNEIDPQVLTALDELRGKADAIELSSWRTYPTPLPVPVIGNFLIRACLSSVWSSRCSGRSPSVLLAGPGSKEYGALRYWFKAWRK